MRARRSGLLLLPLLALAACAESDAPVAVPAESDPQAAASDPLSRIETGRVTLARIETRMAASGSIQARRVTAIGAEVQGRLAEVLVDVGDDVAEGQPLFRIDPVPYEMALAEARAGLALARAESANAAQDAERVRRLAAQDAASTQHLDQLRTAAAVARARVDQMQARVARAERDLERTQVRAPYAGSIVERRAHEGAMAGPEPILVLQETGALEVVLAVPEAWPVPVRVGDAVRLHVEGLPAPLETHIGRVSARVDAETRTYEVRGPVEDPSRTVKAGSYVRADLLLGSPEPVPVVDRSSLLMRDGRTYAFRVAGDAVERVAVRVGIVNADHAQILDGLESGDEVVRGEVVARLAPGTRIERAESLSAPRHEGTP